jgi:Lrp/AsnC family transcriptional regulator for asnA, asnC and gidA
MNAAGTNSANGRGASAKPLQLDAVSKAIIEQLQEDGRRSYAEIGKAVGLSEAAVRQRVQKLTESGVMQVVAVTDPMQLGFYRQAMIGLKVTGDTTAVLAEVVCENDDDLIELLNKRIRAIDGVLSTETFVYLRLHKQFYNWGTR